MYSKSPFGQRPRRGWWAMLSHISGIFSFFFFSSVRSNHLPPNLILASRLKSQSRDPNPSPEAQIPASRLKSQPQGPNPSLEAQVLASRPKSQCQGQIPASRPKSQPLKPSPSLEALIPASRFKSQPWDPHPALRPKSKLPEEGGGENMWKLRSSTLLEPLPCSIHQLQAQLT